jgi:hypothetical protein
MDITTKRKRVETVAPKIERTAETDKRSLEEKEIPLRILASTDLTNLEERAAVYEESIKCLDREKNSDANRPYGGGGWGSPKNKCISISNVNHDQPEKVLYFSTYSGGCPNVHEP